MSTRESGDKASTSKDGQEAGKKNNLQSRSGGAKVAPSVHRQAKFEGKCADLKGHIYDCSTSKQADQFNKTTKEISEYVGRTYTYGGDARLAIENLAVVEPPEPDDPPEGATATKRRIWEKRVDEYVKRTTHMTENIKSIFSLVWGQCTDIMRQKLEALNNFANMSAEGDGIELLKAIKNITHNFQSQKYLPHAIHEAKRRIYMFSQGKMSTIEYYEQFLSLVSVLDAIKASFGQDPGIEAMVAAEHNKSVEDLNNEDRQEAKEMYLATAFILGCDRGRYGKLVEDMENDYLQDRGTYPKTVAAAFNLLVNWKQDPRNLMRSVGVTNDGVSFANIDDAEGDQDYEEGVTMTTSGSSTQSKKSSKGSRRGKERDMSKYKCGRCGEYGHYPTHCDGTRVQRLSDGDTDTASATSSLTAGSSTGGASRQTGATMLLAGLAEGDFDYGDNITTGFQFLTNGISTVLQTMCKEHSNGRAVPDSWILLDNQSTVDVFHNAKLLRNIRRSPTYMDIHCNAGVTSTNLIGDLPGYGTVWFHPNGIANILSLARVCERGYNVAYDSHTGNHFRVTKSDGSIRVFNKSDRGLFYLDTAQDGISLVNTVADNRTKYNNRDYSRAMLARKLQSLIGRPSVRQYRHIVDRNLLPNCPISCGDINAAEDIFGGDLGCLKGKTVRRPTPHAPSKLIPIPMQIFKQYRNVTLAGDIFQINCIPFFATISHHIRFVTSEMVTNQKAETLINSIKQVRTHYAQRGFRITTMILDGQFEPLRGNLADLNIALETCGHDDHVPEAERHIRTLKERARAIYNTLPFQRLPARMVIELIHYCTFWLNAFPHGDGVSDVLSPRAIVAGLSIDYTKHCRIEYGAYAQVHEDHNNTMAPRTTGAIAMRPTGNAHGSYYFFHLNTGRLLNRSRWTELPMPNDVIERVHKLSRKGRQGLEFLNRNGQPFIYPVDAVSDSDDNDDDDDDSYQPSLTGSLSDDGPDTLTLQECSTTLDSYSMADNVDIDPENTVNPENDPDDDPNDGGQQLAGVADDEEDNDRNEDEQQVAGGNEITGMPNQHVDDDDGDPVVNIAAEMDARYGPRTSQHNLRPRKLRDYSHMHIIFTEAGNTKPSKPCDYRHGHDVLEHIAMTQHGLKRGLKEFGDAGIDAVLKELKQLHDRQVIEAVNPTTMTREQKHAALHYLMFLKKKRCGRIKGRGCADGRKQRLYTPKEEASSPTVAIESVILSCVIDAKETRDVATVDLPGAFMHADMDDEVFMKLEGKMAELLVQLDPDRYAKCVTTENGRNTLHVRLKKALYGTLKAALLFWKHLSGKLQGWGFIPNPYDSCVVNKDIDGAQCTILWHVDDLKISHVNPEVVTNVIKQLEAEFGKEAPLTVNRGKTHEYLGMTIDYSTPGKVKIGMIDYVKNMLDELPDDMKGESATPAANHLFQVDNAAEKLSSKKSIMFHHNAAKLLFLCKRARPDVQTATAFLCTRVKAPDIDDYKKLGRVMRYLRATRDMVLTLESDSVNIMKWWVDASFAVHPDMKSHTGAIMSLGRGAMYSTSMRQKLNGRSSTEGELIGVSDVLPQILWTRFFLEAQGYPIKESIVYQDNQSAILLEKNGRASSSKRTRHINIRYFFVTDRIKSKELSVEYCPTGQMLADFFTKPLQGTPFRKFRDDIMGIDPRLLPIMDNRSVLGLDTVDSKASDSVDVAESHEGHSMTLRVCGITSQPE